MPLRLCKYRERELRKVDPSKRSRIIREARRVLTCNRKFIDHYLDK